VGRNGNEGIPGVTDGWRVLYGCGGGLDSFAGGVVMSKYTKGPWRVGPVDDTRISTHDNDEIALVQGDYNDPDIWPVMEANARLIAAAPELAEALEATLSWLTSYPGEGALKSYDKARAALAKAGVE
jgi:hypothetical protein